MSIKAIETVYNGYRFRSRLEARWAVFFDTLGIKYEYEKEGFDLGGMHYSNDFVDDELLEAPKELKYLPDFWLSGLDWWVEIKGEHPTAEEDLKARLLALATGKKVHIFFGEIPMLEQTTYSDGKYSWWNLVPQSDSAYVWFPDGGMDFPYQWCECPQCGIVGIQWSACSDRLSCKHDKWTDYFPRLIAAYTAARQARFEYGEKPQPVNVRKEIVSKPKKIRKKLKDSQVDLIRGDRVRHPMFGDGTIEIESRDRSPVYIRFDSGEKSGWFVPFADLLKIH